MPITSLTPLDPVPAEVFPRMPGAYDGRGFLVRTAYGSTALSNLASARALLDDPGQQVAAYVQNTPVVNFYGNAEGIFSTSNRAFAGQTMGDDGNHFAVEATARVFIPAAGEWTFGVNSDDGFRLAVGGNTMEFDGGRGSTTSLATWTFDAPGEYDLNLLYFEITGSAQVELFAAQGRKETVDSGFRLVGDASLGGLAVRSDTATVASPITGKPGFVATRFEVRFAPLSTNATYRIDVAPAPADAYGNSMNQDGDATNGESPQDIYIGSFAIDRQPFRIVSTSPSPIANGALDRIDVTFSAPVQGGTFTASDVEIVGALLTAKILSVEALSPTLHRVHLDPITGEGNYEIRIGPGIADIAGNLLNQDLDERGGEPEDRFVTFIRVENTAPRILEYAPRGTIGAGRNTIELTFTEPIRLDSFGADDITVTGPAGALPAPTSITAVSGATYRVTYAAPFATGTYRIVVGPGITDGAGQPLDQDGDGIAGEPVEDRFANSFTVDATGPRVLSLTPTDAVTQPLSQVTVRFSEPILESSFRPVDVGLTGPQGAVSGFGVVRVDDTTYRLTFPAQSAHGTYTLVVGPEVTDLLGNPMDQDDDGVPGSPTDAFRAELLVRLPDLVPSQLVLPATAQPGQTITVRWRVTNIGNDAVTSPWTDAVIASSTGSPTGPASAVVLVGTLESTGPLAAGEFVDRALDITVPITFSGTVTLFVSSDSNPQRIVEADENNLVSRTLEVVVGPPPVDLVVTSVTSPASADSGGNLTLGWVVRNQGGRATTTNAWRDRVVLSQDTTLDDFDLELATVAHTGALDPDATYTVTQEFVLPESIAGGTYHVFVVTDALDVVPEPGADANANNAARSPTPLVVRAVPTPDLVVTVSTPPASALLGFPLALGWTVRNQGTAPTEGTWTDRVYLSANGTVQGATLLGSFTSSASLGAGESATRSATVAVPNLPDGAYRVVVVTDATNVVFERDGESNNTAAGSEPVTIGHLNLVASTVGHDGIAQAGRPLAVRWQVRNSGSASASATWVDRVYLSTDATPGNDVLLGETARTGSPEPGASYDANLATVLPEGIQGTFFLIVVVDAGSAIPTEGGAGRNDNTAVSPAFAVEPGIYADLTVVTASGPDRIIGNPADLTVSWTVRNDGRGPGPVSRWTDRVVLSVDAIYGNGDDRVVGTVAHDGVLPVGATYTETRVFQLPANLENRYRILVRTDAAG
ncbi:MAG: Ig-like domain-containing protein, partial [Verrucomicrobiales bacterium]|nr:Ig-like domain-containing protein [Verrucomicrobiales bacterium]